MIACSSERKTLIAAKELHQQGILSHDELLAVAAEYQGALLSHRKMTGKRFWIPSIRRLISVTRRW